MTEKFSDWKEIHGFYVYTTDVLFKGALNEDEKIFFIYQNLLQSLYDFICKFVSK